MSQPDLPGAEDALDDVYGDVAQSDGDAGHQTRHFELLQVLHALLALLLEQPALLRQHRGAVEARRGIVRDEADAAVVVLERGIEVPKLGVRKAPAKVDLELAVVRELALARVVDLQSLSALWREGKSA